MSQCQAPEPPLSLEEIVTAGLCIGCGLCRSLAGAGRVDMVTTPDGRERPVARAPLDGATLSAINAACPGTWIEGADPADLPADAATDAVWGPISRLAIAHAADPEVRYLGASGGALTALGQYLLETGEVELVLHVKARADAPMRSAATVSETPQEVLDATASRYGPVPVLENLFDVLDRGRPMAVIAKPCDVGAVRRLMAVDARARRLVRYCLALVCGGASDLGKSMEVLDRFGIAEEKLRLFRYRGHGNPGPTRVETRDGRAEEIGYNDLWDDAAGWRIQPRCKVCPDAIGEAADVVSADCWPGGGPTGEDAGFNAVLARTARGVALFDRAVADGALVVDGPAEVREMDDFQPHQVRKKRAVWARFAGMRAAGLPTPRVERLRIAELARGNSLRENLAEARAARRRVHAGRLGEPPARPAETDDTDSA